LQRHLKKSIAKISQSYAKSMVDEKNKGKSEVYSHTGIDTVIHQK